VSYSVPGFVNDFAGFKEECLRLNTSGRGFLVNSRSESAVSPWLLLLGILPIHFLCFYWWSAPSHYFSGDALYYFSRQIHSFPELAARLLSVDELFQYRPLTYVGFSFVLVPIFGNNPYPYHVTAYAFSTVNVLLACACVYHWVGRNWRLAVFASIFLVLNPVHFFPSFGPTYIDQWLSSFFYFLTLLMVFRGLPAARILAPVTFALALLSKEHSVMLPLHAVLVLLVLDVRLREALRKTRDLWIVLVVFVVFQLVIRDGRVFAPEGANPNLQFTLSATRIVELLKGAKPAFFYPENYAMDQIIGFGRTIRLAVLIPLLAVVVIAVKRKPKLALSGILWLAFSVVPVIFLRQPPAPRHYYLGLPGVAILFACAFPSWRTMMVATPAFALLTITNVHLYARESWVAVGARLTKNYLGRIETLLQETGRSSFYVTNGGDPHFFWHVDGGAALPFVLGQNATFRFASLKEPLETDKWLNNGVNVVFAQNGQITDSVKTGEFPPSTDPKICSVVRQLTDTERDCSILFRGQPLDGESSPVETPSHLPVFEVPEGLVTLSRTTIRIAADDGFQLRSDVLVDPKSVDGMMVEIYGYHDSLFKKEFSQALIPGEHRELSYFIPPDVFDYVFIRIHPGPNSDEQNDWLVWETQTR